MRNTVPLILGLLVCLLTASNATAQADPVREGLSSTGLCGLVLTAFPTCPTRVGLTASAGYGYTESIGPVPGAHHRIAGSIGAGVVPLSWLAVSLRLDGRYDFHPPDQYGDDSTGIGEPRLYLRAGHDLSKKLSLGGEMVVWMPGANAPSLDPSATTVDLKVLAAYRPSQRFALLGHVGGRLDQSERTAPDPTRIRSGDRISLNVSDSHAILFGLGLSTRALAQTELFGEVSLDLLVGPKAPAFIESPFRLSAGARRFFAHHMQGELTTTFSLSRRPDVASTAPLVPIEPRFLVQLGFRYGIPLYEPPPPPPPPVVVEPPVPVITTTNVSGVLLDPQGVPLPDVRVVLRRSDQPPREDVTDGDGRYHFDEVASGTVTFEASAPGFATDTWNVEVGPNMEPLAARTLVAKANVGTLRVLARTFRSEPLTAVVAVRDRGGKRVLDQKTDDDGLLEIDLPPGRYTVLISAPGYRPHRREVQIERFGVAILNVDLRESR